MMNNQVKFQNLNAIILAGGESSRMNYPKAWLPHSDNQTILGHLIESYESIGCQQIIVVMNNKFVNFNPHYLKEIKSRARIIENYNPEKGRIHSLCLGIENLRRSGVTFIHNVDNPFANKETLRALLSSSINGYSRPVIDGKGGHPILVTNGVLENIILADEATILRELLEEHACEDVNVSDTGILCNINTPEEYYNLFGMSIPSS